jgi:prophage regulatory protein
MQGQEKLLRVKDVLQRVKICRATWYAGVRHGRFPKPVGLAGGRAKFYRESDIDALIASAAPAEK